MPAEDLTPAQVAGLLDLDKQTVYRLIRQRRLAARQIGRAYRIPREDFEAFLRADGTGPEVRRALLARVNAIADRNPGLDSDDLLEELEREDAERKRRRAS